MELLIVLVGFAGGVLCSFVLCKFLDRKSTALGTIIVSRSDGKTTYSLELDGDVDEVLESKDAILFVVRH